MIEAMKLALEALKRLKAYGNVFRFRQDEQNPYDQACEAIAILRTAIEQAERQQALDKKAENARELGLDYYIPCCKDQTCPKCVAAKQEPVAWMIWTHGPVRVFVNKEEAKIEFERLTIAYPEQSRKLRPLILSDTTPQPKREWVELTDEEIEAADYITMTREDYEVYSINQDSVMDFARAIEAKLKERNS